MEDNDDEDYVDCVDDEGSRLILCILRNCMIRFAWWNCSMKLFSDTLSDYLSRMLTLPLIGLIISGEDEDDDDDDGLITSDNWVLSECASYEWHNLLGRSDHDEDQSKTKTDATSVSEALSNKEWKIVRKVSDVMYNETMKDMIEKGQGMQALKVYDSLKSLDYLNNWLSMNTKGCGESIR